MDEEVKALKSELALLKRQFSERVDTVESRLNSLLSPEAHQGHQPSDILILKDNSQPVKKPLRTEVKAAAKNKPEPSKPSFISLFFQAILASLFDWFSPASKIYQSYKARGMLGIFILTIAGIGLTLAGFGYLMQLLIDQLGAGSKSLLMCFAAILVMGLGIGLKLKTKFDEFSTAIVTLGILLSYSTVYFSGSVYGIIPTVIVLLLYLLIALICHVLALWLETKIVAGLGIIGIATMPILSNTIQIEPLYYLLSLAFVTASSLILAYKKSESWLANLTLAFCIIALEWTISSGAMNVSAWIVNVFYLLFFTYITVSLLKNVKPNPKTLIFLAALVGSILVLFSQVSELFSIQMSLAFAFNALVTTCISVIFYKIRHTLTHFIVLLATLWTVLAVISAISNAYWGIAWAIEGIMLLLIARRYQMPKVVNQAQILTATALLYSLSAIAMYFPLPALKTIDGWVLSLVIVIIIGTWQRLINSTVVFDKLTQHKVKPILQLLEVIWLSILLIGSLHVWVGNWTGAVVILLQIAWLFRAKQCKQVTIEIFTAALILVPLFYLYQGVLIADSYRFMMLPLFAKVAIISAFCQLWLWSAFYRKYMPNSTINNIAEAARVLFYLLIPICWVASTIRRFDENALTIIWLSPLIALFFAHKIKHHLLIKEAKILTVLASITFILIAGQLKLTYGLISLLGFIVFYGTAFYVDQKYVDQKSIYKGHVDKKGKNSPLSKFICSWGLISLGLSIPSMIGFHTDSLLIGLVIASMLWVSYLSLVNRSNYFKSNETFITVINAILIVLAWLLTIDNPMFICIPILFLLTTTYQKKTLFFNTQLGTLFGLNTDLFLHSIMTISYVTLFSSLAEYRLHLLIAPALAIHGALILFMKDRRVFTVKYSFGLILLGITKLALIDAENALLWQKVILFMGIGIFILAASFWYQKIITRVDTELMETP